MADPNEKSSLCVFGILNWCLVLCSEGVSDYLYAKLPLDSCAGY